MEKRWENMEKMGKDGRRWISSPPQVRVTCLDMIWEIPEVGRIFLEGNPKKMSRSGCPGDQRRPRQINGNKWRKWRRIGEENRIT